MTDHMHPCPPVLLIVHQRPQMTQRLIARLATQRPAQLFVAADAAQPGDSAMAERVAATLRAVHEGVDWPCRLEIDAAREPMGCTSRVVSAIDAAFMEVDRLVVLEDDLRPHRGFFAWAADMLERYEDRGDVGQVTGLNLLGRWEGNGLCHALAHVTGTPGFATWRDRWRSAQALPDGAIAHRFETHPHADPIVLQHQLFLRGETTGVTPTWDADWELRRAALGLLTVVPTRNLIANKGSDTHALHPLREDELHRLLPVAPPQACGANERADGEDTRLTRLTLLIKLADAMRRPDVLALLARRQSAGGPASARANAVHHYLLPFTTPGDTAEAIRCRAGAGAPLGPTMTRTLTVFEREAAQRSAGPRTPHQASAT